MINLFEQMKTGNIKQQEAYSAIMDLCVFDELHAYNPVLCGTLPIGIDIKGSDLDIIMEVQELDFLQSNYKLFTLIKKISL